MVIVSMQHCGGEDPGGRGEFGVEALRGGGIVVDVDNEAWEWWCLWAVT